MTEDTTPHGLHRRSLLLGGAGLGAGLVTSADLIDVPAAAAGTRTRIHFQGAFKNPNTPDWHYLPFRVPRGVRAIEVRYDFKPHDTGVGFSTNVVDIGIFDPSGKGLGNADGFRGWSGGARRHFRITHRWATPGYLAGPDHPRPLARHPRPVPDHRARYAVARHGHPGARQGRPSRRSSPTTRRSPYPAPAPGWYRGDLHTHSVHSDGQWTPAQLVGAGPGQRPGLPRHLRPQHQRRHPGLRPRRPRRLPGGQRRGGDDPQRPLAGDRYDARHLGRLALPRRGPPAGRGSPTSPAAAAASRSRPTRSCRSPGTRWDFGTTWTEVDAVEVWNGPWSFFNQLTLNAWQQQLVAGGYTPAVGNSDSHHDGQVVGLPADGLPSRHLVERGDRGRSPGRPLLDRGVVGGRPDLQRHRRRCDHHRRRAGRHRDPGRRRAAGLHVSPRPACPAPSPS